MKGNCKLYVDDIYSDILNHKMSRNPVHQVFIDIRTQFPGGSCIEKLMPFNLIGRHAI